MIAAIKAAYLRFRIKETLRDILITQAEVSSAPARLSLYERELDSLRRRLRALTGST